MKTAKKFLSVLMCAAMLFGSIAVLGGIAPEASAAYEKQEGYLSFKVREDEAVLVDCAENATGEITVPATVGGVPVKRLASEPDEIMSGGHGAFENCTGITKVNLPDSIIDLGYGAFNGCTNLAEVNIPSGVTEIGIGCFDQCENLKSIVIPDGVKRIGRYAFEGCKRLREVIVPDSVTEIGDSAFMDCESLERAALSRNIATIEHDLFLRCYSLDGIDIPDGVTVIGDSAFFNCTSLESVSIPSSVEAIEGRAFDGCTSLKSIELPSGVFEVGASVFDNTAIYNKKSNWQDGVLYIGDVLVKAEASLGGAYDVKPGTRVIAGYAFAYCDSLTSVTLPDGLVFIGDWAFYNCTELTGVNIPDSVVSIGHLAFGQTQIMDSFNWDNNVLYIDNALIAAASNLSGSYTVKPGTIVIAEDGLTYIDTLTEVILPDSMKYIGKSAFEGCENLKRVVIPKDLERIEERAFAFCSSLGSVNIPNSVNYIGSGAFLQCGSIKKIVLPPNLNIIRAYTFTGCESLEEVNIPDGVTRIGYGAFWECTALKSVEIPDRVTSIEINAFYGSGLESVYIPASVEEIEQYAFSDCSHLEKITVSPESKYYANDRNGVLFTKDMRTLVTVPFGSTFTEYTVPDGVYELLSYSIVGNIEVVNIPASVDSCEDAFGWRQNLTAINVDPGNKQYASDECGVLYNKEMTELLCYPQGNTRDRYRVPDGVTVISDQGFTYYSALRIISLPDSLMIMPHFDRFDYNMQLIYFRGNKDQWESLEDEWGNGHSDTCPSVVIGRDIPESEAKLNSDLALANFKTRLVSFKFGIQNIINRIIDFINQIINGNNNW